MISKQLWEISAPKFESDEINPQLKFAYWEGHRDFAYDFVRFIRPARIVELGSQYGCSLFSFCQAIKDNHIEAELHAVDFWSGDIGAPHPGEVVFQSVKNIKETFFADLNLHLYPMSFDDAVEQFDDESIDLLHIDGGHRYEDVDHDFNLWLPKLKKNGIILFHDVFSTIDSGSCEHWEYIKTKYDLHFEFPHSCGLGVLFPKGDEWYQKLQQAGLSGEVLDIYRYRSELIYTQRRFEELSALYEKRFEAIEQQSAMIKERDEAIAAQAKMLDERFAAIEQQSAMIKERDEAIAAQAKMLDERFAAIEQQSTMIKERDEAIAAQAKMLDERYETIQQMSTMIDERDKTIEQLRPKLD